MLKFLFYAFGVVAIALELFNIKKAFNIKEFEVKAKAIQQIPREQRTQDEITQLAEGCFYILFQLMYFIWCMVGLFTFQWPVFLFMVLMGFVASAGLRKYRLYSQIDSVICIILIFFAILNAYHFNIDIVKSVIAFFS